MKKKIAISGAGTGAGFAAAAVAAIPDAELIGICAPSETRRGPLCEKYGGTGYADFEEMLRARPDVVIICSPNRFRVRQFAQTLDAGIDGLLDKPLATSDGELDTVMTAAQRAPERFVGAMLQHSFNPGVLAATRFIREGYLGVPISAQITLPWGRFGAYLDGHYRASNNDGVALNQAPHAKQALLQIAAPTVEGLAPGQHPVVRVCGTSNRNAHHDDLRCETETTAVGTFILANGLPINYSLTAGTKVSDKWWVSLLGRDGKIRVREDGVVIRSETAIAAGTLPDWLPFETEATASAPGAPNASSNAAGSGSSFHRLFIEDFLRRREQDRPSGLQQLVVGSWSTALGLAMLSTGQLERITTPRDYSFLLTS